jgi:hypothetical protein
MLVSGFSFACSSAEGELANAEPCFLAVVKELVLTGDGCLKFLSFQGLVSVSVHPLYVFRAS